MNVFLLGLCMVVLFAIIVGLIVFVRYLSYRETISQAEQGLQRQETPKSKPLLRWGMVITVLGLILTLGLYAVGFLSTDSYPLHLGPWMLGGLIPLFLGLGLLLLHYLTEKE